MEKKLDGRPGYTFWTEVARSSQQANKGIAEIERISLASVQPEKEKFSTRIAHSAHDSTAIDTPIAGSLHTDALVDSTGILTTNILPAEHNKQFADFLNTYGQTALPGFGAVDASSLLLHEETIEAGGSRFQHTSDETIQSPAKTAARKTRGATGGRKEYKLWREEEPHGENTALDDIVTQRAAALNTETATSVASLPPSTSRLSNTHVFSENLRMPAPCRVGIFTVDSIIGERVLSSVAGGTEDRFLVLWKGYTIWDATWESWDDIGEACRDQWKRDKAELEEILEAVDQYGVSTWISRSAS